MSQFQVRFEFTLCSCSRTLCSVDMWPKSDDPVVVNNYQPTFVVHIPYWHRLAMVKVVLTRRKDSLHPRMEIKAYAMHQQGASLRDIAQEIPNLEGNPPGVATVKRVLDRFSTRLGKFQSDALRYPILIVKGASGSGKTEWAQSLFECPLVVKIGSSEVFPTGLRNFDRLKNDGLILDDVRDLQLIVSNQEVFQGKYSDPIELASTQGGTCAFFLYLFRVPIVATINFTTQNCEYLVSNDFLNKPQNRVVVNWPPAGFAGF